jgi:hypothetical protein
MEKEFELILSNREMSPIMQRIEDSIKDIIEFDVLDSEVYK